MTTTERKPDSLQYYEEGDPRQYDEGYIGPSEPDDPPESRPHHPMNQTS